MTLDHNFATNMNRTKQHICNFINFIAIVKKIVFSSPEVSNDKQTIIEKQILNPENKTNNNYPIEQLKNCWRIFSGTTKIYLINERPIPTPLHLNRNKETNPNLHKEITLSDENYFQMTNMIVKMQIGCTILTPDLFIQTGTTMNIITVIEKIVKDQLLFIEILQIVPLRLQTKETNHHQKSNC